MNKKKRRFLIDIGVQLLCILLLLWPALFNGYPLLAPDSGTYLTSGHHSIIPVDRPIIYGLFVRHISLSWSVWLVVFMQAILFNYVIYLISKYFIKSKRHSLVQLVIIALLALGTSIVEYSSMIMTDVFTSISLLSLFLLLYIDMKEKKHLFLLTLLFIFSAIIHLSHIPLLIAELVLISLFLIIINKGELRSKLKRIALTTALLIGAVCTLAIINYSYGVGFKLSRASNIMWATRFIESGIANDYLKKHCNEAEFNAPYSELCNYTDQFEKWPTAGIYLFTNSSPLYQGGCLDEDWTACWLQKNKAYGELISDILTESEYRKKYLNLIVHGTFNQLISFNEPHLDPFQFPWIIDKYFPIDSESFINSEQYNGRIELNKADVIQIGIVSLSFLLILMLLTFYWNKISFESKLFLFIIISSLLLNALIVSSLSNVAPRYQERIIFLLPLGLISVLLKFKNRLSQKDD